MEAVWGNLKFDVQPDMQQLALGQAWRLQSPRPIVLLASSREGEEAQWLAAVQALPASAAPAVQWLIVPRHPQRFAEVADLARAAGFEVAVIEDACRAIDLDGSLARAWADMAAAGVRRVHSGNLH